MRRNLLPPLLALTLAACRSVDPGLGVADPSIPATATATAPFAAGPIQFLPVVGIPADKATQLSQALAKSAAAAGVPIQSSDVGVAPLRLKGYLSAVREPDDTLVVFVWDLVDPAGERVGRIQDQVRIPGTGADAWSIVGPDALSNIADRTITALRSSVAPQTPGNR